MRKHYTVTSIRLPDELAELVKSAAASQYTSIGAAVHSRVHRPAARPLGAGVTRAILTGSDCATAEGCTATSVLALCRKLLAGC